MHDIFLSHSHKDKPFARQLAVSLEIKGFHAWLDEAEIQVGDSLISKIEAAIHDCEYLGVVLSSNSVSSEWVRREVNIALTEEIKGKHVKVLPLLIEKCDVPPFLIDKLYADFTTNFDEGLERLVSRLQNDMSNEYNKQRRASELLRAAYDEWILFGRQETHLMQKDKTELILCHLPQNHLSVNLLEYLLSSIYVSLDIQETSITKISNWLGELSIGELNDLFQRFFQNPIISIRLGGISVVQILSIKELVDLVIDTVKHDSDVQVKRAGLHTVTSVLRGLPNDHARSILEGENDWVFQSYAIKTLTDQVPCLLISDGTQFSSDLADDARASGFKVVQFEPESLSSDFEELNDELVMSYKLIILVRGEHFSQMSNELFYSRLARLITLKGLTLFATSWVSWEAKFHSDFEKILPFNHVMNSYSENVNVKCQLTNHPLSSEFFERHFKYQTSYELLAPKQDAVVLLETPERVPLFGFKQCGLGICYYLNTCQHTCYGEMKSPLQDSSELRDSLQKIFNWLYKQANQKL